jgi:hypothetical protein
MQAPHIQIAPKIVLGAHLYIYMHGERERERDRAIYRERNSYVKILIMKLNPV